MSAYMNIGIALYAQVDGRGRPTSPHWALVAHPTNYLAPDVMVFQVRQRGPTSWVLAHNPSCSLANAPTLMGVIHISDIRMTAVALSHFINTRFTATKDDDDPSGNMFWSCSNWVIRVIYYLAVKNLLQLPCHIHEIYDRVVVKRGHLNPSRPIPF